jgi:hypothetical protein
MTPAPIAIRVVGSLTSRREIVDYRKAILAYAHADPAAQYELPAFLSVYSFPQMFKIHVESTESTAGYTGPIGVPTMHFDIDRADLAVAIHDAARLVSYLVDRYGDDVLVHFSGSKGFHVMVPTVGFIEPAPDNPRIVKALACCLARDADVVIDEGVYDGVRLWRAPNSRHQKTGCHKVRIDLDDLPFLEPDEVRRLAGQPVAYEPPNPSEPAARLVEDWNATTQAVRANADERRPLRPGAASVRMLNQETLRRINRLTRLLITDPTSVQVGERHRVLLSAAANLAEFQTVDELICALLTEPGLDTGLPPADVARQIRCGIEHARRRTERGTP